MIRSISAVLLLLALFTSSCCKKTFCTTPAGLGVGLVGFDLAEIDTIYTTGYALGSGLTTVKREQQLDTVTVEYNSDSVFFVKPKSNGILSEAYEWKIFIPAVNKTYTITDYGYKSYKCGGCGHKKEETRTLSTCLLNGVRTHVGALRIRK
jgi:hypothetical protein